MPAYFSDTPPAPPRKAKRVKPIRPRTLAKRKAAGERYIHSSIASSSRTPLKKKAVMIRRKSKKRERNDPARIYGPKAFRDFLHSEACLGCGFHRVEQAHRFTGGTGRKDSWKRTVPLCSPRIVGGLGGRFEIGCHRRYDEAKKSFAKERSLPARAAQFWNRWLLEAGRLGLDPDTGKKLAGRTGSEGQ